MIAKADHSSDSGPATRSDHPDCGSRLSQVALASLVEPGNRELGELLRTVGPQVALDRLLAGAVSEPMAGAVATRLAAHRVPATMAGALDLGAAAVELSERLGVNLVLPGDDDWPEWLADLARINTGQAASAIDRDVLPPLCLWTRGAAPLRGALERAVAIVGARAATDYGSHVAAELAYNLAVRDWTVVSGGAFGIDAAAHRGALAAGGATVAILACGIDRVYPQAHATLFEQIADSGLILSEWPPGSAPFRQRFLIRNRVIAAATRGTVMVEAAVRSGARQTIGRARALGRMTMVVPGPVTSAGSAGCHAELRAWPGTRLITTAEEIIEEVGSVGELAPLPRGDVKAHDLLDSLAARVLDAVPRRRPKTAEEIAVAAGVSGRDARRTLPALVAAGFVALDDGGYRLTAARRPR